MTGNGNRNEGAGEERARRAVKGLPRPEARPDFRARLKEDFLSGAIERSAPPRPAPPRRRRSLRGWMFAAAAVVLVVLGWQLNRGPALRVLDAQGTGAIETAGRSVSATDVLALQRAIRPERRLELSGDARIDIAYGRTVVMQIAPGSIFTPPASPGRWFGRSMNADLEFGEARIMTGPDFPGADLTIHTPEGITLLTGTIVSVFRDSSVTCVCVLEGKARIGVDEADLEWIPSGKRKVMFRDGSPSTVTEIAPPHQAGLRELEEKYEELF